MPTAKTIWPENHPLADIVPRMSDEEFRKLRKDIRDNGLADPITLYEQQILDGRNRYRACRELGIEPCFVDWAGPGSPLAFVISKNLQRRHLNDTQRALLAARLVPAFEAEAKENMSRGGQGSANLPTLHSRDRAAGVARVSPRLAGSAAVVLERGVPALVAAVERGEVKVSPAATVAALDPVEQQRLVVEGPQAVRARAAELRRVARNEAKPADGRAGGPEDCGSRPEGGFAGAGETEVPMTGDAPDAEWLAGFPLRSKLKDARVFDQQALFYRHALAALDAVRRACPGFDADARARRSDFFRWDPLPADIAGVVSPRDWVLCSWCRGRNGARRRGDPCLKCRGDGFTIPVPEPGAIDT